MGAQAFGPLSHCHRPTGACGGVVRGGAGGGAGASCSHDVGCGDGKGGASCCHGVGCDGAAEAPSLRTTRVF